MTHLEFDVPKDLNDMLMPGRVVAFAREMNIFASKLQGTYARTPVIALGTIGINSMAMKKYSGQK